MTREKMLAILADELERVESELPPGAHVHIADIRADKNLGAGMNAAIRAMARVEKDCDAER
jgi:hypothetical protein